MLKPCLYLFFEGGGGVAGGGEGDRVGWSACGVGGFGGPDES